MKKHLIVMLGALLVVAPAVPATAKVNLSGAIWATYWSQQEGSVNAQTAVGGSWVDVGEATGLTGAFGNPASFDKKKTFLVGTSMFGNGTQARAMANSGFVLALDCPVNDWLKAYGEVNVFNANALPLQQGFINLAFMKEFNLRAGLMQIPFGRENTRRPTVGCEEVFVTEFSQDARAQLQTRFDVGVQALGTLAGGMLDYNLFIGNGAISTVADSAAVMTASNATPDNNDAKQMGLNVTFKPFTGVFIGGAYFAGDYTQGLSAGGRAKATSYDVNAGYEYGNIFSITGEYARTRHAQMATAYDFGPTPGNGATVENKVNEYIIKAIYTGIADWELGVRYSAVDPANIEAEVMAGYSFEKKASFAAGYKFARAAFLKAEYSWLRTSYSFTNALAAVAGRVRQNPTQDLNDDILALSLGLQF